MGGFTFDVVLVIVTYQISKADQPLSPPQGMGHFENSWKRKSGAPGTGRFISVSIFPSAFLPVHCFAFLHCAFIFLHFPPFASFRLLSFPLPPFFAFSSLCPLPSVPSFALRHEWIGQRKKRQPTRVRTRDWFLYHTTEVRLDPTGKK